MNGKQQIVDELIEWGHRVHMPDVRDYANDIVDKVLASIPDGTLKAGGEWFNLADQRHEVTVRLRDAAKATR